MASHQRHTKKQERHLCKHKVSWYQRWSVDVWIHRLPKQTESIQKKREIQKEVIYKPARNGPTQVGSVRLDIISITGTTLTYRIFAEFWLQNVDREIITCPSKYQLCHADDGYLSSGTAGSMIVSDHTSFIFMMVSALEVSIIESKSSPTQTKPYAISITGRI